MFSTVATIMIIASLILGAGGATVVSAQAAQPDQPLYSVKVWSEDLRLKLTSDPIEGYQLALEFTDRRAEEVQAMIAAGVVPPESVETRYQNQIDQTIRLALQLSNEKAVQALQQIQIRLQEQQQALLQVRANGADTAEGVLLQTRSMIQQKLQWVQQALDDPEQVREQIQQQIQQREQDQVQNGQMNSDGSISTTVPAPGSQEGNSWTEGAPASGNGYSAGSATTSSGSNPWTTGTPTPGSGYGSGTGSNPWTTGTPTPGSSYGPGTGSCTATCQGPQTTSQGGNH